MTLHIHNLWGCAPAPLAHYLKALGILRLVAEQADPSARGWWQDEHFRLLTTLDRDVLEQFFLNEYIPTPFVSPWNKGAGFFKENDPGLSSVSTSKADRLSRFREGIDQAKMIIEEITEADATVRAIKARVNTTKHGFQTGDQRNRLRNSRVFRDYEAELELRLADKHLPLKQKDEAKEELATLNLLVSDASSPPTKLQAADLKTKTGYKRLLARANQRFKRLKDSLLPECYRHWRGQAGEWLASAVVIDGNNEATWPSLLGTGGNEGNLDYTNSAMRRLVELFDADDPHGKASNQARAQLKHSLWSEPSNMLATNPVGQFLPGSAGGANSTTAADGSPLVNPWDFILMLEGAILFSSRATRRMDPQSLRRASAPFVMHAHAAGFLSSGGEKDQRGEQWMPLWNQPSTLHDLSAMIGEGRLGVGRQVAHRPLDAARAVARLGVARGVHAFTRYGYLERNGQSNLAVSLGRIVVQPRPYARLADDIVLWLDRLRRLARDKHAPARLVHAERRLANAVFAALTHDDTSERWQLVLRAMTAIEGIQAGGTAITAGPIPRLNPAWIKAADDGSVEFRLAVALGSAAGRYRKRDGRWLPVDPVRHHWLPLEAKNPRRFQIQDKRLARNARVVMHGRDPLGDLTALVQRRFIEGTMTNDQQRRLPLMAAPGCSASLCDLADLLAGRVDLERTSELARAFMAIDWSDIRQDHLPERSQSNSEPAEAWLALRLSCLPWPLDRNHDIRAEPAMIRRLIASDGSGAIAIALRRLRAAGLRPPLKAGFADSYTARLWAAALAFPISFGSARRAAKRLDPSFTGDPHD